MNRELELEAFHAAWSNYEPFKNLPTAHQEKLVQLCEAGLFRNVCETYLKTHADLDWENQALIDAYSSRGAQILYNLDVKSNLNVEWLEDDPAAIEKSLAARVLRGYAYFYMCLPSAKCISSDVKEFGMVDPETISYMNGVEMNELINKEYKDRIEERKKQIQQVTYSQMYKCSRCGARKTVEESKQTRSLDECNTVRLTCANCGKTWRPNA